MENKKQDRALQAPSEANRDKHMNYLAAEEQKENADMTENEGNGEDEKNEKFSEKSSRNKHDSDSGNDGSTNQMLEQENLIDPGNEHNHMKNSQTGNNNDYRSTKFDADSGGDSTGTIGNKLGE